MSRRMKALNFVGGCYVILSFVTAMAATKTSYSSIATQPKSVAQAFQSNLGSSQRLSDDEKRAGVTITIHSVPGCHWCVKIKREIPTLQRLGYTVLVKGQTSATRSYPFTRVTKGGMRWFTFCGYKSAQAIDNLVLNSRSLTTTNPRRDLFLTLWLNENSKMYSEVAKLEAMGYQVTVRGSSIPWDVKAFPITVVTLKGFLGPQLMAIHGFRTAKELDDYITSRDFVLP